MWVLIGDAIHKLVEGLLSVNKFEFYHHVPVELEPHLECKPDLSDSFSSFG